MSDADRIAAARSLAAAPGTVAGLHAAIKARMAEVVAALPVLATKAREPVVDTDVPQARTADVLEFDTPPRDQGHERFPFVMVRPTGGNDSPQGADEVSLASFDLVVGTYSDTDDGGVDALLLIDAIRLSLLSRPVLAGTGYEHTGPLKWDTENLGALRPQWLAKASTQWTLPRPARVE